MADYNEGDRVVLTQELRIADNAYLAKGAKGVVRATRPPAKPLLSRVSRLRGDNRDAAWEAKVHFAYDVIAWAPFDALDINNANT